MRFRTSRQDIEAADKRSWNYDPYRATPVETQSTIEPVSNLSEAEIRALHDQWRAKQAQLDVEWRDYHAGIAKLRRLDIADYCETTKDRERKLAELTQRQKALNAEREALPPLPQVVSSGSSPKRLHTNMTQAMGEGARAQRTRARGLGFVIPSRPSSPPSITPSRQRLGVGVMA